MFCKHRFAIVKRFVDKETETLSTIERCRWCHKWRRCNVKIATSDLKVLPVLRIQQIVENVEAERIPWNASKA